jgi:DNA-directed RNA polymerase II subunit RPB7
LVFLPHFPSSLPNQQVIENNTKIRIKIIGTRVDATEIVRDASVTFDPKITHTFPPLQFAIGTIKEDHLGVIE